MFLFQGRYNLHISDTSQSFFPSTAAKHLIPYHHGLPPPTFQTDRHEQWQQNRDIPLNIVVGQKGSLQSYTISSHITRLVKFPTNLTPLYKSLVSTRSRCHVFFFFSGLSPSRPRRQGHQNLKDPQPVPMPTSNSLARLERSPNLVGWLVVCWQPVVG